MVGCEGYFPPIQCQESPLHHVLRRCPDPEPGEHIQATVILTKHWARSLATHRPSPCRENTVKHKTG